MAGHLRRITVTTVGAVLVLPGAGLAAAAHLSPVVSYSSAQCSAGAHTLAPPGSHLYPETGNGGYTSVHTLVHLVYDAATNQFLPGNRVVLTDRATQCLSSFSLDFERKSANTKAGPDMTVQSVTVNTEPFAIGAAGVISSLLAGHWVPFSASAAVWTLGSSGEQAGGSGLCFGPPTGLVCDASCAAGLGSFCPCGSPG